MNFKAGLKALSKSSVMLYVAENLAWVMQSLGLKDTDATNKLTVTWDEDDSADRTLKVKVDGANRTLTIDEDIKGSLIVNQADVDDTPVDGVTTAPVSSNWAYDHAAAADPHTGYVKESDFTAADTVLVGTGVGTLGAVTLAASQFLAKKAAGAATNVTAGEARTILNVANGANAYVHPNHSGEVTSLADGAQTIANDAVTYAKMQNVSAADKVLGRVTAGAGDVEEIACTAAGRALLDDANAAAQATTLGLGSGDSPTHVTVKLSGLTDLKVPKHVSDAVGLADTPITVSANGEVTIATQPAFLAIAGVKNDVTGNGVAYTVVFDASEPFDQNADFDGTSTFTAPVTGKYHFDVYLDLKGLAAANTRSQLYLVASNRTITLENKNIGDSLYASEYAGTGGSATVDMDAADTVTIQVIVSGGTQIIDLVAGSNFSGHLVC
uniref:C1q domain-containing protein n=1 Tax=viral metagenome TaxID=1070528 RepID=A0A6M3ILI5_9ZZZZ